ncbi:MAG TPA: chemotaxis protein CheB [Arenimonas sp.]|nr:chemotaxis protein CheB [Arenimonas sp.]
MADAPIRIALLGRAGDAREQLRKALVDLGADLVAEGDPAELDPGVLIGLKPKVLLISLEPAIEDALDRFNDVLASPDVEVMFDDAEVTRGLEGWDLARWARHLAAKLVGSDVLPPAPAGSEALGDVDLSPVPGAPPTPAQLMDHAKLEDYAAEAGGMLDEVPSEPSLASVAVDVDVTAADSGSHAEVGELDLGIDVDLSQLEQAMSSEPEPEPAADEMAAAPAASGETLDFDAELPARSFGEMAAEADAGPDLDFSLDVDIAGLDRALAQDATPVAPSEPEAVADEEGSGLLADLEFDSDAPVSFASLAGDEEPAAGALDMDADVAALAAQLDAGAGMTSLADDTLNAAADESGFELPDFAAAEVSGAGDAADSAGGDDGLGGLSLPGEFELPDPTAAAEAEATLSEQEASSLPELGALDFAAPEPQLAETEPTSPLSLSTDEGEPAASSAAAPAKPAGGMFAGMTLSLEGDEPAAPAVAAAIPGVVLALAGIGGPDAIKQLLRALPTSIPVPVLVYQHLENGKYDRLADQLGKGSALPMSLAEAGQTLSVGAAFLLPAGLGIAADGDGYRFEAVAGTDALLSALPAAKSAVLALSGAAAELVPAIKAISAQGGLVLAQSPEGCFDTAAIDELIAAGVTAASPSELALQLSLRWNA